MVDPPVRYRVDGEPSSGDDREWEAFVRDGEGDPLRRAGSVRAPSVEEAYELATRLFAWYARDVWVCPTAEIARYSTDGPEDAEPVPIRDGDEGRTHEL